ncbi:MAG: ATP-dependent Clp protease adaptor ClpS [Sulfurimonas sp.]|jgi:ATP-dependent Clp protease adaptor protein ClpS|nr:ATP-dependent Clp protease adaptor ClpS [Sulfurimonadaceae bacterium]
MGLKSDIEVLSELLVKFPKKWVVILLNDDYTSMEFVVEVLMQIFHKSHDEAKKIMLDIHNNGKGVCGVYTHEIAQTKLHQVHSAAKNNSFPLKAIMEQEA